MTGLDDLAKFCRGKLEYKQRNNTMKVGVFGYEEARNQKLRTSFGLYQTQKKERQRKVLQLSKVTSQCRVFVF